MSQLELTSQEGVGAQDGQHQSYNKPDNFISKDEEDEVYDDIDEQYDRSLSNPSSPRYDYQRRYSQSSQGSPILEPPQPLIQNKQYSPYKSKGMAPIPPVPEQQDSIVKAVDEVAVSKQMQQQTYLQQEEVRQKKQLAATYCIWHAIDKYNNRRIALVHSKFCAQ
ncbi:MAG: hypothetical protein EZS28_002889 [Streblomastix strix]|uniref:Uncharacterized protein n=1 Tax=Streblomastix strix TaxID=222440 RepID=A0A5J4X2Y2_9EUKA|nr:MAG: hypothetical protein EZS28_002889 [Streblomastix strix]